MSYHSYSNTPAVVPATPAKSPKYSMSGIANELNAMKTRNGYMSTLFGRTERGTAGKDYSKIGLGKKPASIFSE